MDWRTRIVADPDVLVGKPVIKGTRICVELVLDLLAAGYTTRQIVLLRIPWTDPIADNLFAVSTLASRESWTGIFAVVKRDRIRVRPLPAHSPNGARPETE